MITPFACHHLRSGTGELPLGGLQQQFPSWLKVKLPPLKLDAEVTPLVASKELLPRSWAERRLRRERLSQQNRRTWDKYFHRVNRIVELLQQQLESQTNATVHTISDARPPFDPPHWTGDSSEDLVAVPFPESNVLTLDEAQRLVRELGYDAQAAFASVPHPILMNAEPDRRRFGVVETEDGNWLDRTNVVQPIPYVAAAPGRRTKIGGGFTRDSVLRAVARMRASHKMRMAVFEVVFRRRFPSQIAGEFGVGVRALNKAATRVRKNIRGDVQKTSENAGSEALVGIACA